MNQLDHPQGVASLKSETNINFAPEKNRGFALEVWRKSPNVGNPRF